MERYRLLVESSPDGILIVDDERIAFVNRAAVDLFGANGGDQLLGRSLLDLLDSESHESVREHFLRWRAGRTTLALDAKIVRPDGGTRDISVTGAQAHEGDRAVQLIVRDVTEQKEAERALRESEERLALAVAGAREGVWDWNLETNAVVYSAQWKQMLGYSGAEIEPHISAWERLVHPDDTWRADQANDSVARGERTTYKAEFRLRHKDGHYVYVLSRGFPVRREPGGPVVRIVGTHFDLTERKQAEAALRENEERLKLEPGDRRRGVLVALERDARVRGR
jgi:PAS domain S-box-containing protein